MTALLDVPARVDGVQLIGEMAGSGYRNPPALVRRPDGQVLQLTPLLYLVLSAADGTRSTAQIAEAVGRALGRGLSEEQVATLMSSHLRPLGLVAGEDGSAPEELRRSNPLLALRAKVAVTNPRLTRLLTDPFRPLFWPLVMVVVTLGFLAVTAWVFFERGLGASAYDAFERPHLLLLVFAVSVLSAGFHEFGHAAAARYGGAEPGVMGAGLYIVWPAFYTDVTDSYRLGRGGRIRTDVGGLYFNAIVVVLTFGWWWSTGWEALLLLVATQVLQMVQQLLPLLRFDGYHLLADLAGVPDLYQRIRPTLAGLLPHRWRSPENRALTPWARVVITFWVLVTVPMMVLMLLAMIAAVPRLIGSAISVVREDVSGLAEAWRSGGVIDVAADVLQVLAVVLPTLGCALILGRMGVRSLGGLARWSRSSLPRRILATGLTAVVVTALSWAWWPNPGTYRPIGPDESGTLAALLQDPTGESSTGLVPAAASGTQAAALGRSADDGPLVAAFERGAPLPTRDAPRLAMVLTPTESTGAGESGADEGETGQEPGDDGTWVLPFDKPLPPGEGDNQALAVATEDGSVTYDVAFALVWAEGDEVLNVNEAHAYASCSDCVAVAVAFQVVLVMDGASVIVPQNLAVAANYDCYRCITAAIASQLVLSVPGEPGEEDLRALGEVWDRLIRFAREITSYSLTDIAAQLQSFQDEIVAILDQAPPATDGASPTTAVAESAEEGASPSGTATPTATASPSATAQPTSGPTAASEETGPSPTAGSSPTSGSTTSSAEGASTAEAGTTEPSP